MDKIFDAKKLWIEGGYGRDNQFEISMDRIYKHGDQRKVSRDNVDIILVGFFLELRKDPTRYISDHCICGCENPNSGTNAIHTIFKRIDYKAEKLFEIKMQLWEKDFNEMLTQHLEYNSETERVDETAEEIQPTWADKNIPTFKKWFTKNK